MDYEADFEELVEALPPPSTTSMFGYPALPKASPYSAKSEPPRQVFEKAAPKVNSESWISDGRGGVGGIKSNHPRIEMASPSKFDFLGSLIPAPRSKRESQASSKQKKSGGARSRKKTQSPLQRLKPHLSQYLFEAEEISKLANQLNEERAKNKELTKEIKTLTMLQKRQDKAIKALDGESNDFPKVIERLQSEMKAMKVISQQYKDKIQLNERQHKSSAEELLRLRAKCHKFEELLRDRNLEDCDKLLDEIHQLKESVLEKEQIISELIREKAILIHAREQEYNNMHKEKKALHRDYDHLARTQRDVEEKLHDSQKRLASATLYSRVNGNGGTLTACESSRSSSRQEQNTDEKRELLKPKTKNISESFAGLNHKHPEKKYTGKPETKSEKPKKTVKSEAPTPEPVLEVKKLIELIIPPSQTAALPQIEPEPAVIPQSSIYKPAFRSPTPPPLEALTSSTIYSKPVLAPSSETMKPTIELVDQSGVFITQPATVPAKLSLFSSALSFSSPLKPNFLKFGGGGSTASAATTSSSPFKPALFASPASVVTSPPLVPVAEKAPEPILAKPEALESPIQEVATPPSLILEINALKALEGKVSLIKDQVAQQTRASVAVTQPWEKLYANLPVSATDTALAEQKLKSAETKLKELEKSYPDGSDLETIIVRKRKEELRKEVVRLRGGTKNLESAAISENNTTQTKHVEELKTDVPKKEHKLDFLNNTITPAQTFTPIGKPPHKLDFLQSSKPDISKLQSNQITSGPTFVNKPVETPFTITSNKLASANTEDEDGGYLPSFLGGQARNRRGLSSVATGSSTTANNFSSKPSIVHKTDDNEIEDLDEEIMSM